MSRLQHTVAFRLDSSVELAWFLGQCRCLADIPGVINFEVLEQFGTKNPYSHALSMWFDDVDAYDAYNEHPDHEAFVSTVWLPNVADFVELDYRRT